LCKSERKGRKKIKTLDAGPTINHLYPEASSPKPDLILGLFISLKINSFCFKMNSFVPLAANFEDW